MVVRGFELSLKPSATVAGCVSPSRMTSVDEGDEGRLPKITVCFSGQASAELTTTTSLEELSLWIRCCRSRHGKRKICSVQTQTRHQRQRVVWIRRITRRVLCDEHGWL